MANSQIRHLRFYLLDDSIEFEQKHIAKYIAAGWDVTRDRCWFKYVHPYPEVSDRYWMFKEAFLNMIAIPIANYPRTFMSDYERLRQLQLDFRICHHQLACSQAFSSVLRLLGFASRQSEEVHRPLLQRVLMIAANLGREFNFGPHPDIVLEIVREAYVLSNIRRLPDIRVLAYVENFLEQTSNPASTLHRNIVQELRNELRSKINEELNLISNWTPLQILNRLHAPSLEARYSRDGVGLEGLARRSAQMIVLHWKVWAPILYNHPDDQTARRSTDSATAAVAADEASERMSSLNLDHQTRSSYINNGVAASLSPSNDETVRSKDRNQNHSNSDHTEDSTTEDEKETAA